MARKRAKHADEKLADKKHGDRKQTGKKLTTRAKVKSTKAEPARAPDAPTEHTDAAYQPKDAQTVEKNVPDNYLLAVTSANLQALRDRVQPDTAKRGREKSGKIVISNEGNALISALEKLEAAYHELLQR